MIIYLCTKFQSNTPILSKYIAWKLFFKVENFSKLKWAITPKIIGGFYPKSNLAYFYDYIPVYKISIQYTNPFKRYRTGTKSVTYGTDGHTDSGDTICPPTLEIWGRGGGIIKTYQTLCYWKLTSPKSCKCVNGLIMVKKFIYRVHMPGIQGRGWKAEL